MDPKHDQYKAKPQYCRFLMLQDELTKKIFVSDTKHPGMHLIKVYMHAKHAMR